MVLSLKMEDAGEEGSHQRKNFEACLLSDLSSAAGGRQQELKGNTLLRFAALKQFLVCNRRGGKTLSNYAHLWGQHLHFHPHP